MIEPGAQHLLQRHHARRAAGVQHVHIERKTGFQRGRTEYGFHQYFRFHPPRARLQHQPHVLAAFVAHIGQQRQLLFFQQLRHLLDQLGLLHLIGDLGHDDLPGAVLALLDRPFGAQPETTASRFVGDTQRIGVFRPARHRWESPGRACGAAGPQRMRSDDGSNGSPPHRSRRRCAAGSMWPCPLRCRLRHWRAGWGTHRAARRVRIPRRHRLGGNPPYRCRCRPASRWRPGSTALQCNASRRGYRRRCCRSSPGPSTSG